jgi:hypothetical protein
VVLGVQQVLRALHRTTAGVPTLSHMRPAVLDATPYVEIGVDVLADIVRGLIHLLIGVTVAASASLGAWRAPS